MGVMLSPKPTENDLSLLSAILIIIIITETICMVWHILFRVNGITISRVDQLAFKVLAISIIHSYKVSIK